MTRKNNRQNKIKRTEQLIRREKERDEINKRKLEARQMHEKERSAQLKKKPKVPPVVSSEMKKKKLLAK